MKNTNKKAIIKFALFVIIFAGLGIASSYIAGLIMHKELLKIENVVGTIIGAATFGYFLFLRKHKE